MANADAPARWRWDWKSLCGDEGFVVWSPQRHDFGLCFQQLCIEVPALAVLACVSAYYFGRHEEFVQRGRLQMVAINFRCVVVLLLAFLPLLQIYIDVNENANPIARMAYFLSAVQGIAWFAHFLYLRGLRKRLGKSPRGPTLMCVVWSLLFVMSVISVRSHYLVYKYDISGSFSVQLSYIFSICYLIVQGAYSLSLLPSEGDTQTVNIVDRFGDSERQPLLHHNAYVRFREEGDPAYLGVAMEGSSWFSKLIFHWVKPLMDKGAQGKLSNEDDLFDLPMSLNCANISTKLDQELANVKVNNEGSNQNATRSLFPSASLFRRKATLLVALHRCFWLQFYGIGVLKLVADITAFAGPMLLNKLVGFIENKSEDIKWGYAYTAGLLLATLTTSLCGSHFDFLMSMIGLRMRASLVTAIYKKTLSVSSTTLNSRFSVGEIVNFMSTDTDRIVNSCPSFHALWSTPFQLAVTLYLLYVQVGLAFLAGLIFGIILIPINKLIADKIGRLSTKLMEQKDARVRVITEVLRGIKAIKLYVWEQHFIRQISRLRDKELKYLKGRKYLDAVCVYFWATTPVVISILTFATYVLMGNQLTAATVFTCIALLNMLISPLNAFPWVLNGMTEAWVSIKRIQKFLDLPDLDLKEYYKDEISGEDDNADIIIRNGGFNWGKELTTEEKVKLHSANKRKSNKGKGKGKRSAFARLNVEERILEEDEPVIFKLEAINLKVRRGEFVGVIGSVACGKSSLLSAILAELAMDSGEMAISQNEAGFGVVLQQPWLQRGTIRDNILFGKPFDTSKYNEVLFACCLTEDVNNLPAGDMTGVGEGGSTLSGGQRARVALARAAYQEKSVYLLDDILSAVDVNVAKHIFQHCIMGLLRNKTRILCTHHVQYLAYADRIILMENGRIKDEGKPAEVLSNIDDTLPIDIELGESLQSVSLSSNSFLESCKQNEETHSGQDRDSLLHVETSNVGSVNLGVYGSYWKATGHLLSLAVLLSVGLMQSSRNVSDWWLAQWVTSAENNGTSNATRFGRLDHEILMKANPLEEVYMSSYLKIYIELAILNTVFTLFRAFLFAYGAVIAAAKLHKMLLKSVMKGQSVFFDRTPTGRILNRFSSDTYTIDDSLPFNLNILLAQVSGLIGILVITIYGLPWICLVLVPLIPVYHWLQNHYRLTSRELKRISSVTLSPVYNHFNESLQGLVSIRAFRAVQRFKRSNLDHIEANLKAQLSAQAAIRWLGIRLQFIGVAVLSSIAFIAVIQHQFDVADPGLVGLAISYALSVTGALSGVVNAFTETEREMIAVERVNQYVNEIPSETSHFVSDPPFGWPSQGVISFDSVVLKYRENLAAALNGITFESRPSEKIGVVGRTGAGKSSIVSAIFRLVEVTSGSICIDSVDIRRISLATLRARLFCIPQDPFLFGGTLRDNLDPLGEFRDNEMWNALGKVNMAGTIRNLGGLENKVETSGNNFSAGQKQLICLARAVLHNAKVLCVDEATASVDLETDRQIQSTLRSAFRKSTVITIAHRIQTVLDSDRVIVMDEGKIVEMGPPDELLADAGSYFYQLANQE